MPHTGSGAEMHPDSLILVQYKLFACLTSFLPYLLPYLFPCLCTSSRIGSFCLQARGHRRRPNLALVVCTDVTLIEIKIKIAIFLENQTELISRFFGASVTQF